ncbi:hypothetical protein HDU87_005127 [Geranomyces variabilis]|uniref:Uncharacterized protein n=1 Tax=Geranomyces variabilis TaxID=109894 RepID=A0AAD5XUA3_9FUNG|nr:hypothetical protein HDU87_005127 [Geranomyces variabilis]
MRCKNDFAHVELDAENLTTIILKMIGLAAINGAPIQGGIVTQPTATEVKTLLARLAEAFKSKEVRCYWTGVALIPRATSGFQQLSLDRIDDQTLSYVHPEQRVVASSLWANYLLGSYDYATRLRLIGFMKANYTPDRADGAMSAYRTGHDSGVHFSAVDTKYWRDKWHNQSVVHRMNRLTREGRYNASDVYPTLHWLNYAKEADATYYTNEAFATLTNKPPNVASVEVVIRQQRRMLETMFAHWDGRL